MNAMALDIRTMAIMAALTSVLQALALVTLWRAVPQEPGPREWALGGIMLACGMLLISFRNLVPDWASVILANVLIVAAHAAYLAGVNRYQMRPPDNAVIGVSMLTTVLLFGYFTYVDPNVSARIVVISCVLVILAATAAFRLSRAHSVNLAGAELLVIFMLVVHALFHGARGAYTYFHDQGIADFMQASTIHAAAFADIVIFGFVAGLGFSIMTVVRINRRLSVELESRTTLLSVIAHDIRGPFSALISLTNLVSTSLDKGNTTEARALTVKVSTAAEATLTLLEDLLVWSKAEFGSSTRLASSLNLNDLVERKLRLFEGQVQRKRIEITVRNGLSSLHHYADEIEMVVRNLLSNAVKFCPIDGQLTVESKQVPGGTEIQISNTLPPPALQGRSEEEAPNAAGSRTAGRDEAAGMGIGLILCRKLCEKAGHKLILENNSDERFTASFIIRDLETAT